MELPEIEWMLDNNFPVDVILDKLCFDYLYERDKERLDNTTVSVPA